MPSRRRAREFSLKALYQMDISKRWDVEEALGDKGLIDRKGVDMEYSMRLIRGVIGHLHSLDRMIEDASEHWRIERMNVVDRNILRLAVFELLYCTDVPYKVVIDEAVELGKVYGTEDSPSFINGILDAIAKRHVLHESKRSQSV